MDAEREIVKYVELQEARGGVEAPLAVLSLEELRQAWAAARTIRVALDGVRDGGGGQIAARERELAAEIVAREQAAGTGGDPAIGRPPAPGCRCRGRAVRATVEGRR